MTTTNISSSGVIPAKSAVIDNQFVEIAEYKSMSYSRLFKAKRFGKWMLLKCLLPEFRGIALYESLLMKEAEISLQLEHPNVLRSYSWEEVGDLGLCLVMEFVDGWTLDEFLKTNPSAKECGNIARQLLGAMDYFHSLQIVHRDLKPSNIMVTRNGLHVKVIDFGLSDTDSYAVLKQPAGTYSYAAPEQIEGTGAVDARADIYSFGVVLKKIFRGRFAPLYAYVARKCSKTDRDSRFESAAAVLRFLDRTNSAIKFLINSVLVLAVTMLVLMFNNGKKQDAQSTSAHVDTLMQVVMHHDTVNVTSTQIVHDTVVVPCVFPKERQNAQREMRSFVERQLQPIKSRVDHGGFRFDLSFRASITNCYLYCQKQLREKLRKRVSDNYPKDVVYADIDSVVGAVTGRFRAIYEDDYPSFIKEQVDLLHRIENDSSLNVYSRKERMDAFSKLYDDDVVKYEE